MRLRFGRPLPFPMSIPWEAPPSSLIIGPSHPHQRLLAQRCGLQLFLLPSPAVGSACIAFFGMPFMQYRSGRPVGLLRMVFARPGHRTSKECGNRETHRIEKLSTLLCPSPVPHLGSSFPGRQRPSGSSHHQAPRSVLHNGNTKMRVHDSQQQGREQEEAVTANFCAVSVGGGCDGPTKLTKMAGSSKD